MISLAIIGGSGLYDFEGLSETRWIKVTTPFGDPSDEILTGRFQGRDVAFLPRHARGHRILPGELNHRANIWALKSLGVQSIVSVSAVGSLQDAYHPLDIMLPDQFIDRTKKSLEHTFFGKGIVAHVSLADPICKELQLLVFKEADTVLRSAADGKARPPRCHLNGTYVNMEGPAFSTRAESNMYRQWGGDIIGMTNLGEARLAREAEMAYATMAMVTDFDCWKTDEEAVTLEMILARMHQNASTSKEIIRRIIPVIPEKPQWPCHEALKTSLVTDKKLWPSETVERLRPILQSYL